MKEIVLEHLPEEDLHAALGQALEVHPGGVHGGDVVDADAADALHHHHVRAHVVPVHLRHVQVRRVQPVAAQLAGVAGLAHQIEFVEQRQLELAHHFHRPQAARLAHHPVREPGQHVQQADIAPDARRDARPHHLDDDLAPVRQAPGVHLGDRRRRQRHVVEFGQHHAQRLAVGGLDQPARLLARKRRHLVLQAHQLVGNVRRQQVAPGGQDLPELDEDRPELFKRLAQAHAARRARTPAPGQQAQQQAPARQARVTEDDLVAAGARQHEQHPPQAQQTRQAGHC